MEFKWIFPGSDPHQLLGIFTDKEFLADFAREIPVAEHRAEIIRHAPGDVETVLFWTIATNHVPAVFRPFVPSKVNLEWRTRWSGRDTAAIRGSFNAKSPNPACTFAGVTSIDANDEGASVWKLKGPVTAKRRGLLSGNFIASHLVDLFRAVLKDQAGVAERQLGGLPEQPSHDT